MKNSREEKPMKAGEKIFTIFWLFLGAFFTWQSVLLYKQSPDLSSYGTVPLACSALITILAVIVLLEDSRKMSETSGMPFGEKVRYTLPRILPSDLAVVIGLMILYCIALYASVGFLISTSLFLWCSMSYLSRGNYLKNILWSALCMLFIYLIFKMVFHVILP